MKEHPTSAIVVLIFIPVGLSACGLLQVASPPPGETVSAIEATGTRTATLPPPPGATITKTEAPTITKTETPTITPTATPLPPKIEEIISRCPSADQLAAIDADLILQFDADPTSGALVCSAAQGSADLTRLQERAYQAILMMQQIHFDQPLPWTDKSLYDWFIGAVDGIRFRGDIQASFCCEPAGFINVQTNNLAALQTSRWIDPQMGTGLDGLMILFVHEARHNETGAHTCGDKDNTIAEMGAWGVQHELLMWLAYHTDPAFYSPEDMYPTYYREWALAYAREVRQYRLCNEPQATPGPTPTLRP